MLLAAPLLPATLSYFRLCENVPPVNQQHLLLSTSTMCPSVEWVPVHSSFCGHDELHDQLKRESSLFQFTGHSPPLRDVRTRTQAGTESSSQGGMVLADWFTDLCLAHFFFFYTVQDHLSA